MSDQDTTARPHLIVEHWCEHAGCSKWGGAGYAKTKLDAPRWWCWEHYPYKSMEVLNDE